MPTHTALTMIEVQQQIRDRLLPEPILRTACIDIFADALQAAHLSGTSTRAVTVEREDLLRLHAGHTIVCTLCSPSLARLSGAIWMALEEKELNRLHDVRSLVDQSAPCR